MDLVIEMKVFYLDSFLLLNLVIDYLLMILTAKLCCIQVKRSRVILAAIFGSLFAAGMFFYSGTTLAMLIITCITTWILISIVFSKTSAVKRLRLSAIFLLEAFCFSGCMSMAENIGVGRITVRNGITYIQIEFWQVIVSAIGGYLLFRVCFRDYSLKVEKQRVKLIAELGQQRIETMLLVDSGNLLREPLSGKPVIMLAPEVMEGFFVSEINDRLKQPEWDPAVMMAILVDYGIVTRILPIQTVGGSRCLTLAVKPDRITLKMDNGTAKIDEYWIGIARSDIDICGGCRGVIGTC